MAFRWWADDGPLLVLFGKKKDVVIRWGPPLSKRSGSARGLYGNIQNVDIVLRLLKMILSVSSHQY